MEKWKTEKQYSGQSPLKYYTRPRRQHKIPPEFNDKCINCFKCVEICPGDVLRESPKKPSVVYPDECWHCGACMMDCPTSAVKLNLPLWMRPVAKRVK